MTTPMRPTEEDLHAFIDGELDAVRAAEVEAAIQADADLARQVHAYRADKARLAQVYGPLIERPLPEEWVTRIANRNIVALPAKTPRRRMIGMALAASIAVIAGGTVVYRQVRTQGGGDLIALAMDAHARAGTIPAQSVADNALAKIVGVAVKAPDLSKMGFTLVGMDTRGGAAVLAYKDTGERLFTLYLKASPGTPHFDMIRRGETRICIWQDDVLSTVMLADVSAAEMLRLASLAYSGLTA